MRAGWNPGRRNRNVGTKAHGHGQDNRLVIPESLPQGKRFYEQLSSYVVVERRIGDRVLKFLVEPPRSGWFHPCTVDDLCWVLAHVPPEDVATFDMVVMRQPTRKQRVLSPVWGRAVFVFDSPEVSGTAVILEAQNEEPIHWPLSLSPEQQRELERLRADGHVVHRAKRRYEISTTRETLRNTMLYRTLLHEIGHHVDHALLSLEEWDGFTQTEKEDRAHRHAAQQRERLRHLGVLPFAKLADPEELLRSGLLSEWF